MFSSTLEVPIPGTNQKYRYDLSACFLVEKQLEDIETLNIQRSNALLAALYKVSFEVIQAMDSISRLESKAKNRVSQRKAVIVIDEMAPTLKALGLTSNDSNRQGLIDKDPAYQELVEQHQDIEASYELLRLRNQKYEDAIRTVRSIAYNLVATASRQNPNLTAQIGQIENETVGISTDEKYGKARYG